MTTGTPPLTGLAGRDGEPVRLPTDGLRPALLATAALTGAALVAAAVLADGPAVAGVALAGLLVAGYFVLGQLAAGAATAYAPQLSVWIALLTYLTQVLVLALLLVLALGSGAVGEEGPVDVDWLGGAIIVGTLTWVAALVRHTLRQPPPPLLRWRVIDAAEAPPDARMAPLATDGSGSGD